MAEYAPGHITFANACFDNSEQKSNAIDVEGQGHCDKCFDK